MTKLACLLAMAVSASASLVQYRAIECTGSGLSNTCMYKPMEVPLANVCTRLTGHFLNHLGTLHAAVNTMCRVCADTDCSTCTPYAEKHNNLYSGEYGFVDGLEFGKAAQALQCYEVDPALFEPHP